MNFGTKLRTVLRIATSLQTAIALTTAVITESHNRTLMIAWAIFSVACDFVVAFITTYFNNDYTETAAKYTGMMRLEKEQNKGIFTGEDFTDECDEFDFEDYEEHDGFAEGGENE